MEKVDDHNCSVIWIPSFTYNNRLEVYEPSVLESLYISKDFSKFRISLVKEDTNVEMKIDPNAENSIIFDVGDSDVIIERDFDVAIIHTEIFSEMNIPSVFNIRSESYTWN